MFYEKIARFVANMKDGEGDIRFVNYYNIQAKVLAQFVEGIFSGIGLSRGQAHSVAALLVHADLRNVRSHGTALILHYVDQIRGGGASATSRYSVVAETASTAVIDAEGGLGAVASEKAVQLCREKARHSPISMVSVRNSNHFGMAAHWALKLSGEDMIGFACSNSAPAMCPPGGTRPFIGNNPFSFAFNAGERYPEVCVDMATSAAAFGKAREMAKQGIPIPEGWLLDGDGKPTTRIEDCQMLVPMAQHKGFGLALVVELFATLLSGGVLSPDMNNPDLPDMPELASHSFACFNISAFRDVAQFQQSADAYIGAIHALPMLEGHAAARYPGESSYQAKRYNLEHGVALPELRVQELVALGKEVGVDGSFLLNDKTNRT